jgi:hypothetical protein
MKRIALSSALVAALATVALAATAQARVVPPDGTVLAENLGTVTTPASSPTASNDAEKTGTATSDGTSITVTDADGGSITCAVPAGFDVTPFLTGQVKAECKDANGVLTLTEIKSSTTGAEAESGDDGDVENVDDGDVSNVDDGDVDDVDDGEVDDVDDGEVESVDDGGVNNVDDDDANDVEDGDSGGGDD